MQSPSKQRKAGHGSVHTEMECLGLRTYNTKTCATRAVFKHSGVLRLYKLELPSLFGVLLRDEGIIISREDPQLFDKELDKLLREEFGPLIWPEPSKGNREHLLEARFGTLYESDLIYPRDDTIIKSHLRRLILAKTARPDINVQALIEKRHKDANLKVFRTTTSSLPATPTTIPDASSITQLLSPQTTPARRDTIADCFQEMDDSKSGDSVLGTTTRRRAVQEAGNSHTGYSSVELRLYRRIDPNRPGNNGPVYPYGPWFLTSDCTTSHDCFTRICERIGTDCSFMVFRLPEDMSQEGSIRLDRGSGHSEALFQRVLEVFRKAKTYPGEPQYHSVEVEVGLDMPLDG